MTTSVVIPVYNHWELTLQVFGDFLRSCKKSIDEIVVVNDASTDDIVYKGLAFWKSQGILPIKELRLEENHGFLKASNKGMAKASGDYLFLISNDVRIYQNIVQAGVDYLKDNPNDEVGIVLYDKDTGWNSHNGVVYPYLDGSVIGCTKELWNRIGGLDELYAPYDFEDVDFSTSVKSLGGDLKEFPGMAHHLGAQTNHYSPEREKITRRNQQRFFEKWAN